MRKIVLLEHISLDGLMAGPNGEMDWIRLDEGMWSHVERLQETADTAIYGSKTFKMMENYWPTAADQPGATSHDKNHAAWVNAAQKIVFSNTLTETSWVNTKFVTGRPGEEVAKLKQQAGGDMILIGSASLAATFIAEGLVDEYWLNMNPVLLGAGASLFKDVEQRTNLKVVSTTTFDAGSVAIHLTRA